jgi:GxxExxY protein
LLTIKYKFYGTLTQNLTDSILNAFFKVYNVLGFGFLEKVYENALFIELTKRGFKVVKQRPIKVYYDGEQVGEYFADLIVDDLIIIELKAAEGIIEEHKHQVLNYLKATDKEVGLLLNFGKKPELKRKVFENKNKNLR